MANTLTAAPTNALAWPTAKEAFVKSRDTSWAEPYGGVTPYYPQQRYLDQNLAPNLNITNTQLEALAQANQIARKNKLMSPKLLDAMLPTLLVEGNSRINGWYYPNTPKYQALIDKSGYTENPRRGAPSTESTDYDTELLSSQMMHAMMAAKEKDYGTDLAIERWNGKGVAKRGNEIHADAKNHARKVEEMTRLLEDPKNAPLREKWRALNALYAGAGAGPQEIRPGPDAPPNWEDNLPGIIGVPIAAAREMLPSTNILRDIRRGIRNFTAPE